MVNVESFQWKLLWRRELFEWEKELQEQLLLILNTTQWKRNGSNDWIWGKEEGNSYIVKSGYALLENTGDRMVKEEFQMLWNLKAAPLALFLVWRVLWNRIPTRANLAVRGVQLVSTTCSMCNMYEESVDHLFLNCDIARKVWDNYDKWIDNTTVRPHSILNHFQSFYLMKLNNKSNLVWLGVWVAVVWEIWVQRNKVIFNEGVDDAVEIFSLAQLKGWLWAKYKNIGLYFSLAEWLLCPLQCLK